jgi:nitrate reductase alpha subunit
VIGFSPIPAMSMVSYAAGSRYLSLIGGVCMSFYDWYCDLPPSSPQVWGEQTDVPESADWYNSTFIIAWGSNVPQTRTPDAHFFTEVRYKGAKTVAVTPDYSEVAKLADIWMHPKQGTDAARGDGHGPCDPQGVLLRQAQRLLRRLRAPLHRHAAAGDAQGAHPARRRKVLVPGPLRARQRLRRQARPGQQPRVEDRGLRRQRQGGAAQRLDRLPLGRRRPRRPGQVEPRGQGGPHGDARSSSSCRAGRTARRRTRWREVGFPYFGGIERALPEQRQQRDAQRAGTHGAGARIALGKAGEGARGWWPPCSTCRWPTTASTAACPANSGAKSYDDDTPYTPAWQEKITGVPREQVITVARQFADNADKTHGKSMVIIGAAMNHWYHSDMNYRGVINMLMMCGCIGQSGGGWAHYVGQEKLRPQTGWTALAFALDWIRPPRQMNSTSFFYAHTDQWRYEKLGMEEVALAAGRQEAEVRRQHDRLQRARRAHGLAAQRAAAADQPDAGGARRRRPPAWTKDYVSRRSRTAR